MRLNTRWVLGLGALVLTACGDDDPDRGRRVRAGEPTGEVIGQNEEFTFVPGPPGAHPGIRVEVETADGQTFESDELEVHMVAWDGVTTVERPLGGEGVTGSPQALTAMVDRLWRLSDTDFEPWLAEPVASIELQQRRVARPARMAEEVFEHTNARLVEWAASNASQAGGGNKIGENCPAGTRVQGSGHFDIGTFNDGVTMWQSNTYTVTDFGLALSFVWAFHVAPEGLYLTLQRGLGLQLAPSIGLGVTHSFGWMSFADAALRNSRRLPATTVEGQTLSLSATFDFRTIGVTFIFNDIAEWSLHPGMQADLGVGISYDISGFLGFFSFLKQPFNLTLGTAEISTRTTVDNEPFFLFVTGWTGPCSSQLPTPVGGGAAKNVASVPDFDQLVQNVRLLGETANERSTPVQAALAEMLSATLLPIVEPYANQPGNSPAPGIPAGSNGALVRDFATRDYDVNCTGCPRTSMAGFGRDAVVRLASNGDDESGLMRTTAEVTGELPQLIPQVEELSSRESLVAGATDAIFALAFEALAEDNEDAQRFVSTEVIDLPAQAGLPVYFEFTADEIGELVGRPAADIEGATVCIQADFGGPRLEDSCVVLENGLVNGALTFNDTTQLLFYAAVDLTTAAGEFPDDVSEWEVRPAIRRAVVSPGPAARVEIYGSREIYAGAPATLSAALQDALGNVISEPATFRFTDGLGNTLATVASDNGTALYQFQPDGLTPAVTAFEATTFVAPDESTVDGWAVRGERLSNFATVLIDGTPARELGYITGSISSTELFVVAMGADELAEVGLTSPASLSESARVVVVNPGERSSAP